MTAYDLIDSDDPRADRFYEYATPGCPIGCVTYHDDATGESLVRHGGCGR